MGQERVRFGSFEFDVSTGELRRNGLFVRLQAQPTKVLSHLTARAGQVVSREELHEAIWGGEIFVDFERGLNVCIAQIRGALGDESSAPRYIRTVPRRGYEFICPVESIAEKTPAHTQPAVDVEQPIVARRSRFLLFAFLAALAIVAIIPAGYFGWRHLSPSTASPALIAITRFDNETGDAGANAFSDALSDNVVVQLTAAGKNQFQVIGNASILRGPRGQRDLVQIANTLHAQFVVLGQVQRNGAQVRILAHLIRMPDQTHVWVVRLDRRFDDPFTLEAEAARQIAAEFSVKLTEAAAHGNLHDTSNH